MTWSRPGILARMIRCSRCVVASSSGVVRLKFACGPYAMWVVAEVMYWRVTEPRSWVWDRFLVVQFPPTDVCWQRRG